MRFLGITTHDNHALKAGQWLKSAVSAVSRRVILATPAADVSNWTHNTLEQAAIQTRLLELGVEIRPLRLLEAVGAAAELACVYTGRVESLACEAAVLVTARLPEDGLTRAPSTIAMAVYAGHSYAEELDAAPIGDAVPFRRELTELSQGTLAQAQLPR